MSADLLDLAVRTARAAATLVRERKAAGVTVAATKTSDIDVVTEADRASQDLIRSLISAERPDDAFLGEEGDDLPGTTGVRWVVDPIDGTVNFLYGVRQYAVSIAAERDGATVAGVVLNVPTGVEYAAYVDEDGTAHAARDGEPIRVNPPAPLREMLVGTGFSYDRGVRAHQAAAWATLLPQVRDLRRIGSAALDICAVAEGTADAYAEEGVNLWDYAAAALVAVAAGARVETEVGRGGLTLLTCAPHAAYEEFHDAVRGAGFCAE